MRKNQKDGAVANCTAPLFFKQSVILMILKAKFISLFTAVAMLCSLFTFSVSAAQVPAITWCRTEDAGTYAVVHFETPSEYKNLIDGYEWCTQKDTAWRTVADNQGTSIPVYEGGYVYLRCFKDGQYGAQHSIYVSFGDAFVIADTITQVSAFYRASAAFPENAYMTADRIIGGDVYDSVQTAVQSSKTFALYDIRFLDAQATEFSAGDAAFLRFPLGDTFKRNHCKVYYNDTQNQRMFLLDVTYDRTSAVVRSCGNGLYFITDSWDGQSQIQPPASYKVGQKVSFYGFQLCIGDVNADGVIDPADARLALRAAVSLEQPDILQEECADIDRDGAVSPADARLILRFSVGLQ